MERPGAVVLMASLADWDASLLRRAASEVASGWLIAARLRCCVMPRWGVYVAWADGPARAAPLAGSSGAVSVGNETVTGVGAGVVSALGGVVCRGAVPVVGGLRRVASVSGSCRARTGVESASL
jgi:hypothetical protein